MESKIKFRLQRYAALTLEKMLEISDAEPINCDGVSVELKTIPNVPSKILLIATTYFDAGSLTGLWDKQLSDPRSLAEQAITTVADLLAIATCGGRTVESCAPYFSLSWPSGTSPVVGTDWIITNLPINLEPLGNKYVDLPMLINVARDRISGVSLLSLALSNSNGLGKFVGFCRFFEDAFARGVGQLDKKLAQFLSHNPVELGYLREEVKGWFSHRDGASHADLAVASKHVLESDVSRFIPRMRQAAFDVLLNKKTWHNPSSVRQQRGRPSVVFRENPIHVTATRGRPVDFEYQLIDPFCEWPIAGDCKVDLGIGFVYPTLKAEFPTTLNVLEP